MSPIIRLKSIARHVIKFGDGSYLSHNLAYESRVWQQRFAIRWLNWASAKMVAKSDRFVGTGAHAVRIKGTRAIAHVESGDSSVNEWTVCEVHLKAVTGGSCPECNGDRNLVQVVRRHYLDVAQGSLKKAEDAK